MITPLFVVDQARLRGCAVGDALVVEGDEGRHAVAVRRVRVDEVVHLTDGEGHLITAVVTAVDGKDRLAVRVVDVEVLPRPKVSISVVQAIIKGDRGELAVEMLTEAGVDRIIPWAAQRCIVNWSGKSTGVDKWRRTAREASKQSRRTWFPQIDDVNSTDEVVRLIQQSSTALVLHESAHASLTHANLNGDSVVLIVGPEGGLTDSEVATFADAGAHVVALGPTVLRASTAGIAAVGHVLARLGRWS